MEPFFKDYQNRFEDLIDQIKENVEGLPDEALDWSPGPEMNSLGVLIAHIVGSTKYWINEMALGETIQRVRQEEFDTEGVSVDMALEMLEGGRKNLSESVLKLSLDDLAKMRKAPDSESEFSVGWSLLHAIEHAATHTGHIHITRQLWDQH